MEKTLKSIYGFLFSDFQDELKLAVKDCSTLLDVGCGSNSPVKYLSKDINKTGVDIFEPSILISKDKGIHNQYHKIDVLKISESFEPKSFDCVFASELIEHLEKKDGIELLKQMESLAIKRVVITTPVGFLEQPATEDNPWQLHKSGWDVTEMENYGYKVVGLNGLKSVWNIKFLWRNYEDASLFVKLIRKTLIAITQLFVRNHPKYAFQMMCIKDISN